MSEPKGEALFMAVDMRRRRIRIHKTVIHLMGNPKYIQFLVNPEEMVVAIRSVEQDNPGDQTYKVSQRLLTSKSSYEICSSLLIERLCNVMGVFDHEISFRLPFIWKMISSSGLFTAFSLPRQCVFIYFSKVFIGSLSCIGGRMVCRNVSAPAQ